jgi:ATP-dependent DNA ligase
MTTVKPMLAHKLDKTRIDWGKPVYMQPKLDGVRCLIQYEVFPISQGGARIVAYSRTGKEFMNVDHIKNDLVHMFEACPWIVLDGELYNHNLRDNFEKIISLVRKQKPTDEDKSEARRLIQYHVYDYTGKDYGSFEGLGYRNRLDNLTCSDMYTPSIQYVETKRVKSMKAANDFHARTLAKGYEGSILRTDTPYKHGRSFGLMKFKDFSDKEATIIGYDVGQGKRTGTLGKFVMQDDDGVEFGCPPGKGYTYKDLAEILSNIDKYLGKRATFTYFERTKAGSYRHPLFKTLRDYE